MDTIFLLIQLEASHWRLWDYLKPAGLVSGERDAFGSSSEEGGKGGVLMLVVLMLVVLMLVVLMLVVLMLVVLMLVVEEVASF